MWMPGRSEGEVRIGVAVDIPEPYGAALTRARVEAQDPLALLIPPHITLLPPTAISAEALPQVASHLRAVAAGHVPFVVDLEGTDSFRPVSPVVFVAVSRGAAECGALQASVNSGPLAQELRFPYHPHVTIAHELSAELLDAAAQALGGFTAQFPVASFDLYEHGEDGMWRVVETFALTS